MDNADGWNESLLSDSRVQFILCKDIANERKESLLLFSRVQIILCKDTNFTSNGKHLHAIGLLRLVLRQCAR